MTIRALEPADVSAWKELRQLLWPHLLEGDNDRELANMLARPHRFAVFVAEIQARSVMLRVGTYAKGLVVAA